MLEKDQPVRDGSWTTAEIELINEKASLTTPFMINYYFPESGQVITL
jgi:obg-like ATPase 1